MADAFVRWRALKYGLATAIVPFLLVAVGCDFPAPETAPKSDASVGMADVVSAWSAGDKQRAEDILVAATKSGSAKLDEIDFLRINEAEFVAKGRDQRNTLQQSAMKWVGDIKEIARYMVEDAKQRAAKADIQRSVQR